MLRRRSVPSPGEALYPLLFGNVPINQWPPTDEGDAEIPRLFVEARRATKSGRTTDAVSLWQRIASTAGIESRNVLQAWSYLRQHGVQPESSIAGTVLGVVVEVPVHGGRDVLAAYRDGSVRYLNHSGSVAVVDDPAPVGAAVATVIEAGQTLAQRIGVWDKAELPSLPPDHARLLMLTPGGFRFGQGPDAQLRQEPIASALFAAATHLLTEVVDASQSR